jgi:hypothetical protein
MPCITHQANVPLGSLSSSSASVHICCSTDQSRSLPAAVQSQPPPAPPAASLFAPTHDAAGTTVPAQTPLVLPVDRDDNGDTLPPLHYASWEDSRYSKGERTMKVKVKSCC